MTARDTVAMETPARLATSRMLTAEGRLFDWLLRGTLTVNRLYAYRAFLEGGPGYKRCARGFKDGVYAAIFTFGADGSLHLIVTDWVFWKAFPWGGGHSEGATGRRRRFQDHGG